MINASDAFDRAALARICAMHEHDFEDAFGLDRYQVPQQPAPDDFYLFQDNGSKILAVAHLDTVGRHHQRKARFVNTEDGLVVFSRALDDRLGAYIILDMLPKLGINVDILLTVGEESGRSTAAYFEAVKQYDWMIEFDRGGTDVVMYQYDDDEMRRLVRACGARPADGIFSDISYLDHLGIKGFNWGVGYQDYHGPRAHAFLEDTFEMVNKFVVFHDQNEGEYLAHTTDAEDWWTGYRGMNDDDADYCTCTDTWTCDTCLADMHDIPPAVLADIEDDLNDDHLTDPSSPFYVSDDHWHAQRYAG